MAPSDEMPVHPWPHYPLPPPGQVNIRHELAGLRQALGRLSLAERAELDDALALAGGECAKDTPDPTQLAQACCRIVRSAQASGNFAEHATDILPRIVAIASWLGRPGWTLLKAAGMMG